MAVKRRVPRGGSTTRAHVNTQRIASRHMQHALSGSTHGANFNAAVFIISHEGPFNLPQAFHQALLHLLVCVHLQKGKLQRRGVWTEGGESVEQGNAEHDTPSSLADVP